ncbi:MAG: Omp28-related outer membrane protein [Bacteroidales bacterium]|nr:Omp28-related outer membrane protein [Bacteroidales bacterium]
MKYIITAILPLMFFACDNFEENEYLIYSDGETSESTPVTKTQNHLTVMLEDYTGWKCVNCPSAAALLNELQTKYGEQLVAMSVHAGGFATPNSLNNNLDLTTEYGEKWNSEFGLSSYPIGVINRMNNASSKAVQKDDWDNRISSLLNSLPHKMNINLGAAKKDGYFLVSTEINALEDINNATLISVVVTENGIHGVQLNNESAYGPTPKIEDYVFNHVLRTNARIDMLLKENMAASDVIKKNYTVNIDPSWNTDNCKIIVFVTDATTGEVIQSNEIEVK